MAWTTCSEIFEGALLFIEIGTSVVRSQHACDDMPKTALGDTCADASSPHDGKHALLVSVSVVSNKNARAPCERV
jgi:hypothetical protein